MADLKLSSNLFIGFPELKYFKEALKDNGYIKTLQQIVTSYGIVQAEDDTNFDSFKVVNGSANKVSIQAGVAIDGNINVIELESLLADYFTVPSDSVRYYIILKHATTVVEPGTVNIQADGTLVGVGTTFTDKLRGVPNAASKIKFPNSSNNTQEYQIHSVQSDTLATLNVGAGQLVAETGENWSVVGTFTPGVAILEADKYPFVADSYLIELRASGALVNNEEFLLAEVINDGSSVTIFDRRSGNKFSTTDQTARPISSSNALIGIEQVQYDSVKSARDKNLMTIGWGLSVQNSHWTVDQAKQQITIQTGRGGSWLNISSFADDNFNDWRVIFKTDGTQVAIDDSTKNGATIVLDLAYLAAYPSSGELAIVPNADFVEIVIANATNPTANRTFSFAAASRSAVIPIEAGSASIVSYRHLLADQSTVLATLNTGTYLNETSFNDAGALGTPAYTSTTGGAVTPTLSADNIKDALIPNNTILLFNGAEDSIPSPWQLCNGTNGAPDLRGRFVVGRKEGDTQFGTKGNTGGTKMVTLTEANLPAHTHSVTVTGGDHSHGYRDGFFAEKDSDWNPPAGYGEEIQTVPIAGSDSGFDEDNQRIFYKVRTTDPSGALTLTASASNVGSSEEFYTLPPYYVLAYIIKLGPNGSEENDCCIEEDEYINPLNLGYYKNDVDAAAGGVELNKHYYASQDNDMGLPHGTLKRRTE